MELRGSGDGVEREWRWSWELSWSLAICRKVFQENLRNIFTIQLVNRTYRTKNFVFSFHEQLLWSLSICWKCSLLSSWNQFCLFPMITIHFGERFIYSKYPLFGCCILKLYLTFYLLGVFIFVCSKLVTIKLQ